MTLLLYVKDWFVNLRVIKDSARAVLSVAIGQTAAADDATACNDATEFTKNVWIFYTECTIGPEAVPAIRPGIGRGLPKLVPGLPKRNSSPRTPLLLAYPKFALIIDRFDNRNAICLYRYLLTYGSLDRSDTLKKLCLTYTA